MFFFFFSSRRRHTRLTCDWSSDVCSSDLSVYDEPKQMVKVGVERNGLSGFPLMVRAAEFTFGYLNHAHRDDPPLSKKLITLAGVPTLYIQAQDDTELAQTTQQM